MNPLEEIRITSRQLDNITSVTTMMQSENPSGKKDREGNVTLKSDLHILNVNVKYFENLVEQYNSVAFQAHIDDLLIREDAMTAGILVKGINTMYRTLNDFVNTVCK